MKPITQTKPRKQRNNIMPKTSVYYSAKGFTLIEVLIAVTIIAILASLAYPSYQRHLVDTRRAAAQSCLVELAQFMERFYTTRMTYDLDSSTDTDDDSLPRTQCIQDLNGIYTFGFTNGQPTATTYVLVARPQGAQARADTDCGTLSLTQTGAKDRSGNGDLRRCWR